MELNNLLIEAYKHLDNAQVHDGLGEEDMAVGQLIALQDLLHRELITSESIKCESAESSH